MTEKNALRGERLRRNARVRFQDGPAGGCCTVVRINLRLLVKIRAFKFSLVCAQLVSFNLRARDTPRVVLVRHLHEKPSGDVQDPRGFSSESERDSPYHESFSAEPEKKILPRNSDKLRCITRVTFPSNQGQVSLRASLLFFTRYIHVPMHTQLYDTLCNSHEIKNICSYYIMRR